MNLHEINNLPCALAFYGLKDILEKVLTKVENINAAPCGMSILHCAALGNSFEIIPLLIQHGADVNNTYSTEYGKEGYTPLHLAAECGFLMVASKLIEHSPDLNLKSRSGSTPLHIAASKDIFEMTKLLVDNGAWVNVEDSSKRTPLHIAAYKADFDTCKFLIKKGGFLDVMDVNHQTPHQRALWSDNHALLELLAA